MLGWRMDDQGRSWCEDAYGRRRAIEIPAAAKDRYRRGFGWVIDDILRPWTKYPRGAEVPEADWLLRARLKRAFHLASNTPTQSTNASDTLWMLALAYYGEYVELRVPGVWDKYGVPVPEARSWAMHEGPGPGGKPFQAWHCNTVHDSGWGDGAPGYIEPTAKLLWRRCTSLPLDLRLEADVPYRV